MPVQARTRVNYDTIAPLYDSQPYRQKAVDSHLLAFLQENTARSTTTLAMLDMACGTGSQLLANQRYLQAGRFVGVDLFQGMLQQAQAKTRHISWVQGDCTRPPFADGSFDFISNQFALHHIRDKAAMLHAVHRLLKPGGRFVMMNISPWEMPEWIYYQYFPSALRLDYEDFLPKEGLKALLHQAGFINITLTLESRPYEQDLQQFLATVRRRDTCSQLLAISDLDYQTGLHKLEQDIAQAGHKTPRVQTGIYLLTLCGDKP